MPCSFVGSWLVSAGPPLVKQSRHAPPETGADQEPCYLERDYRPSTKLVPKLCDRTDRLWPLFHGPATGISASPLAGFSPLARPPNSQSKTNVITDEWSRDVAYGGGPRKQLSLVHLYVLASEVQTAPPLIV